MKDFLLRMMALGREDRRVLLIVGPLFFVATASSVLVASFSKALFLSANEMSALPWMFLGSSGFTVVASLAYVTAMERMAMHRRFTVLLGLAVGSFAALRLAYPIHPQTMSLLIYIWCTGIGHLILIQMWNMTSGLLPARQGKRLFPVFAAIATLGAAAGGGLVQLCLRTGVSANDLVWVSGLLLAIPLITVRRVIRELAGALPTVGVEHSPLEVKARKTPGLGRIKGGSEVAKGFRSLINSPLLSRLAVFVFLMQIASVLVDYQFSGSIKAHFAETGAGDEMAGFLGSYYAVSNLMAFFFALVASSRMVRVVGIGIAVASSAIVIALGSAAFMAAHYGDWLAPFWAIAICSFLERITSFALSRNAMQMLVTPIDTRKGERAKTLIDGVVYRFATIAVSIVLLIVGPTALQLHWLSPAAIIASVAVVWVALRIGPHYRRTLFEALRARRLDTSGDPKLREWVAQTAIAEVKQRLRSTDSDDILKSLDLIRDLRLPMEGAALSHLVRHDSSDVVRRTLETMTLLGQKAPREDLLRMLRHDEEPVVLREVLRMMELYTDSDLVSIIRPYARHEDAGVASLAIVWLKKVAGYKSTMDIHMDLMESIRSEDDGKRARAAEMAGMTGWVQATHDLPLMIDDPHLLVRMNAVEAMGQVGIPQYIDPLIVALGRGDLSDRARQALLRYGPALVEEVDSRLEAGQLNLATRIRLIGVVEGIATGDALDLLMKCVDSPDLAIRNQSILSMWRMGRDPMAPMPPRKWVQRELVREIALLDRYMSVRNLVRGHSVRRAFFLDEVSSLQLQCETRAFRLIGMIYSRAAMHRAYLNYRSTARRTRSNAIELLDQHIRDPELREFVGIVERGLEDPQETKDDGTLDGNDAEVAKLLGRDAPWLDRCWVWATTVETIPRIGTVTGEFLSHDPMDMVFLLKSVPLFAGLSGEQLLPVADIVQRVTFERGDVVFEEDQPGLHVYLILEGQVEVIHDGEQVAQLGEKECFGEMALLDHSKRSASIRCLADVVLLAISRDDFQDLLDLHPALAKGVIRVLTHRLREANEEIEVAKSASA